MASSRLPQVYDEGSFRRWVGRQNNADLSPDGKEPADLQAMQVEALIQTLKKVPEAASFETPLTRFRYRRIKQRMRAPDEDIEAEIIASQLGDTAPLSVSPSSPDVRR
jgi:hypothetical protein